MKSNYIYIVLFLFITTTCSFPLDLDMGTYEDFSSTPAYDLAKATNAGDTTKMDLILKDNPTLINYQDPVCARTLLMHTIRNQTRANFPFSVISNTGYDGSISDNP